MAKNAIKQIDVDDIKKRLHDFDIINKNIALYGTGLGSEKVLDALEGYMVTCFVDRDTSDNIGNEFCGLRVCTLDSVYAETDVIIIAARVNHNIIKQRLLDFMQRNDASFEIIDIYGYNTVEEKAEYCDYIEECSLKLKDEFVEYEDKDYKRKENDTKLIAWYLPQYHRIELNDKFHGKGFTEWTNSTQAKPVFTGHYQPHIPYDVGYYDLMNPDTFKRQIELAKNYGIYGFCFHYYWFSGKRIMEKPVEMYLNNKEYVFPFCINWANENWTALWDAGNNEMMLEQKLNKDDVGRFIEDILPYFQDDRYIRIDGKPVLIFYRTNMHTKEQLRYMFTYFKEKCEECGLGGLYIMVTTAGNYMGDASEYNADAIVEFPPWIIGAKCEKIRPKGYINTNFVGDIFDMGEFIENKRYFVKYGSEDYYRSAMVSYDNTSRKCNTGSAIYTGIEPDNYKVWIKDIIDESKKIHSIQKDYVFLNSWNEWAEGSHLEPDMKYGYAYLEAVYEALIESREEPGED